MFFHLGAESHVDHSISNPEPFVLSNVVGTYHILEFARTLPSLKCFFYFSTDEVFGPAPLGTDYGKRIVIIPQIRIPQQKVVEKCW